MKSLTEVHLISCWGNTELENRILDFQKYQIALERKKSGQITPNKCWGDLDMQKGLTWQNMVSSEQPGPEIIKFFTLKHQNRSKPLVCMAQNEYWHYCTELIF